MADNESGQVLLSAQDVSKSFGSQPVLDVVSLSIHENERLGLIGRNGTGKSTLLKILAGRETADTGIVTRQTGLSVAMMGQDCALPTEQTVGEALQEATRRWRDLAERHATLAERLSDDLPDDTRRKLQREFDEVDHQALLHNVWETDARTARMSAALRLPAEDRTIGKLSGGEARRVDLAATLLGEPDVLLLDEPTNHIDADSAMWIEKYLAGYTGACVLVTHDRYFLDQVVTRIVEIDRSRLLSFPGNYEQFLDYKAQILEVEARTESARQSELRRELVWLRRGPKARTTKAKSRVDRVEALAAQAPPEIPVDARFEIPQPHRLGNRVIEAEQLKCVADGRVLFDKLSLILQRGMRLGIAGPNGCGKTTLVRVLMRQQRPDAGEVRVGELTEFLYVDQAHEEIDPSRSVLDFVSGGSNYWDVGEKRIYVPGYLERLLFDMDSVRAPMRNLSGGERNRVMLAKKLLRGGNVLVLDEPTNDLDLSTLRVLEEAILAFDGCAILVSHDRYFLNRLCTHLIVFEEGKTQPYFSAGNYDDYLRVREEQAAAERARTAGDRKAVQAGGGPAQAAASTGNGAKGLTYNEKRELAAMEADIEAAEAEVARIEAEMAAPEFYSQPHDDVRVVLDALDNAKKKSAALYARWEELEARVEKN